VLSCAEPTLKLLEALLDGRRTFLGEQKTGAPSPSPVVLIPTYESTTLSAWQQHNAAELLRLGVELAPAASQCVVQLEAGAGAGGARVDSNQCRAFRLEF